jgi:hypothetical protein
MRLWRAQGIPEHWKGRREQEEVRLLERDSEFHERAFVTLGRLDDIETVRTIQQNSAWRTLCTIDGGVRGTYAQCECPTAGHYVTFLAVHDETRSEAGEKRARSHQFCDARAR